MRESRCGQDRSLAVRSRETIHSRGRRTYYTVGGARVAMRDGAGAALVYLHGDQLGSAYLVTSMTGTVLSQQRYKPGACPERQRRGEVRWSSGAGLPTDFTFTGQRAGPPGYVGSLMDYNARFFSPALGRFVSADTIVPGPGNPAAFNRYMYVLGNPLMLTDPTGHDPTHNAWDYCGLDCVNGPWGYTVNFQNEPGTQAWTTAEKKVVQDAADDIGAALELYYSNLPAPRGAPYGSNRGEVFTTIFGNVNIKKVNDTCAKCFYEVEDAKRIVVYKNAKIGNKLGIVHEFGHVFDRLVSGNNPPWMASANLADIQDKDPKFPNKPDWTEVGDYVGGFAGPTWGWQQTQSGTAVEEYADMFVGFTYSSFAKNNAGGARQDFMSSHMLAWTWAALTVNNR